MSNFRNGNYVVPGACGVGPQVPAVAFYHAQPEPFCPAPGAVRRNTDTIGRDYRIPNKSCRLEFDDIVGNTAVDSLLILGNRECFTDSELRERFGVGEATPIIEPSENCQLKFTVVEGAFTMTVTGTSDAIANSQFAQNAKQLFFGVINDEDCPFKVTRDNRCPPCPEGGDLIQSFGGTHCAPIVVGREMLFGLRIVAGATLEDVALCICAYEVPNMVSCIAPDACPPPPPAPPVCPPYLEYGAVPANGMTVGAAGTQTMMGGTTQTNVAAFGR